MGSLLLFVLIILLLIVVFVFAIIRRFLRGFFSIFRGDSGAKERNENSVSGENYDVVQSEEGAVRMRKFKTLAEDSEYEECVTEK